MGDNHSRELNEIGRNPQCISNLTKFADNYEWSGLKFPIAIKDINVFEMNNDIFINVLLVEDTFIFVGRA